MGFLSTHQRNSTMKSIMVSLGIIGLSSAAAILIASRTTKHRKSTDKMRATKNVCSTPKTNDKNKKKKGKVMNRGDSIFPASKHQFSFRVPSQGKKNPGPQNSEEIGSPLFRELDNCITQKFRQDYRKFRVGESKGAMKMDASLKRCSSHYGNGETTPLDEDESTLFEFATKMDEQYKMVDKFRLDYRNYRSGNAFGAVGSISNLATQLTSVQMKLLPVAQLQELKKFKGNRDRSCRKELHIHFGAGKLGLGLVIPAVLESKCPLAIIQRPSEAWKPILQNEPKCVSLEVNGKSLRSFELLTDDSATPEVTEDTSFFVCSADPILMISLIKKARTFSISLGRGIEKLGRLLKEIIPDAPPEERPALYACENDHKAVHDLEKTLRGRVDVHACMVDRICTTRNITSEKIEIGCEEYEGSIVVQMPPKWSPMPPFKGEAPLVPAIKAETHYLCRRKFMMVNGMHTTLAFMTLCMEEMGNHPGDYLLLNYATASEAVRQEVWQWAVARVLMLAWEHDLEIIKDAHGVESDLEACSVLLDYARVTLRRFSGVKDTTSRVLSGGVANRWETRLQPVNDFLQKTVKVDTFSKLILREAGVKLDNMKSTVEQLCKNSRRFTGKGKENNHQRQQPNRKSKSGPKSNGTPMEHAPTS